MGVVLMPLVGGAIVWLGYTLAWWGWEAMTNRVPEGPDNTFHWPSIRDLVSPARIADAVPAKKD